MGNRGDGHVVVLMAEQVDRAECHVLLALSDGIHPAETFGRIHHLPEPYLASVLPGLRERGLVDASGDFTDAGQATKDRIEAMTDALAEAPYAGLERVVNDELVTALRPIAARLEAGLDIPG